VSGDFDLLETLKWVPGQGVFLVARHLDRIAESARHFGFTCDPDGIRLALDRAVQASSTPLRLRLLLSRDGTVRVERAALDPPRTTARVAFAAAPVDSTDPLLGHKTTNRKLYEDARARTIAARVDDLDDVVLWNEKGQVTESTIANIVAEIDGRRVTPPVTCGLLPGTFRAHLLEDGVIEEGIVTIEQLRSAGQIWLINSVREWWPAALGSQTTATMASTPIRTSAATPQTTNPNQR
jgi:branched-subunit amino acid aminotransferase/4-amino-4-deoxychorismate lyase